MTLSVNIFLSLDGVMQGPGSADEDLSGGFDRGGWLAPYLHDLTVGQIVNSWLARADSLLLGRYTYDMMQPFWELVTDPDDAVAYALNHLPKYLVSSTVENPTWHNTRVLPGDPLNAIEELKRGRGEIQVHGSHRLARSLHDAGMVDEFRLLVFPVVVGTGKRLFDAGSVPSGFQVLESETLDSGTFHLRLRPIPFGTVDMGPRIGL